jgi:hypothetical protein
MADRYGWIDFYELTEGKLVRTDKRPNEQVMVTEIFTFEQRMKQAYPHFPGNIDPHMVPGKLKLIQKDAYTWVPEYPTSKGAVLAHVADLCEVYGYNLPTLWHEAYPAELMPEVDHAACGRPAYDEDFYKVKNDLEGVNLGVLGMVMEKRIMREGGQGKG